MQSETALPTRSALRFVVFTLFLFSGTAALIYQVLWTRMLALVFGATAFALSAVLAAFMAGLGLGSHIFGRIVKVERPLLVFGLLELGIGCYALAFPQILAGIQSLTAGMRSSAGFGFGSLSVIRLVLIFGALVLPTTLMGGTLPVLSSCSAAAPSRSRAGRDVGSLYAVNTAGSVIGAIAAAIVLIAVFGMAGTTRVAVAISMCVGIVAIVLTRPREAAQTESDEAFGPRAPVRRILSTVSIALAVSGATALAFEVIWMRILRLVVINNVYAVAMMLTSVLVGIALGSHFASRRLTGVRNPLLWFAAAELGVGAYAMASLTIVRRLLPALGALSALIGSEHWWQVLLVRFGTGSLLLLFPSFLFGATFPLAIDSVARLGGTVRRITGRLAAVNSVGAAVGSVVGGFVVIPLLGVQRGLLVVAAVNVVVGSYLLARSGAVRIRHGLAISFGVAAAGIALAWAIPAGTYIGTLGGEERPHSALYFKDGIGATVVVLEDDETGERRLATDCVVACGTSYDAQQTVRMLGHLPMLLHDGFPGRVMVVGFGGGTTASCVARHRPERIDCVEIVPGVFDAADYFADVNDDVLSNPLLNVIVDDGRSFLLGARAEYDVITCDPIHPAFGSAALYTKEYYELCLDRLAPGGRMCQYLPLHRLTRDDYRMLLRTFSSVFPYTMVWLTVSHTVLLGSASPIEIDHKELTRRISVPAVGRSLSRVGLDSWASILSRFLLGPSCVAAYAGEGALNTDDRPDVEFSERRSFGVNTAVENLVRLSVAREQGYRELLRLTDGGRLGPAETRELERAFAARGHALKARGYWMGDRYREGLEEYLRALEIAPGDKDVMELAGDEIRRLLERASPGPPAGISP